MLFVHLPSIRKSRQKPTVLFSAAHLLDPSSVHDFTSNIASTASAVNTSGTVQTNAGRIISGTVLIIASTPKDAKPLRNLEQIKHALKSK